MLNMNTNYAHNQAEDAAVITSKNLQPHDISMLNKQKEIIRGFPVFKEEKKGWAVYIKGIEEEPLSKHTNKYSPNLISILTRCDHNGYSYVYIKRCS